MATILVIDDDEPIRALVRKALERNGHRVTEAADGETALARFAEDPPALAIVDLYLPRKSGWETLRDLQQHAPGLPFMIVSAGGPLEGLHRGRAGTLASLRGRAPYRLLRKPFSIRALRAAAGELLATPSASARCTG